VWLVSTWLAERQVVLPARVIGKVRASGLVVPQCIGLRPDGRANETDMIMRNSNTGALEVYDIANNALAGAYSMGAVGLNWEGGGIAPDALNASTASMGASGQVGQLVQATAVFGGGSDAADGLNTAPIDADTSQQPLLMIPQHA